MFCSNCRQLTPAEGNICPHCNFNRSQGQQKKARFEVIFWFGAVGFLAGDAVSGWQGRLVGLLIGMMFGAVICKYEAEITRLKAENEDLKKQIESSEG